MSLSILRGSWAASAPASGVQVIDRFIRASPSIWTQIDDDLIGSTLSSGCIDVATLASIALACRCPVELVLDRVELIRGWRLQLQKLLASPGIAQRTPEWYHARTELTTASDVASAIGGRNGPSKDFLVKKAGCAVEQRPFSSGAPPLKWGVMFEPVANHIYASRMGVQVHEFGLLHHPFINHIGASPDGITDMGVMLEIKCPFSRVIDGSVPSAYRAQIQCQLDVCQLDECDFFECMFEEITSTVEPVSGGVWDGLEQGILVETWDENTQSHAYQYCHEFLTDSINDVQSREDWAARTVESLTLQTSSIVTVRRWRLKCMDMVRICRDPEYITSMNMSLGLTWDRVLRYRLDREAYIAEVLRGCPPASSANLHPSRDVSFKGYAFVDEV